MGLTYARITREVVIHVTKNTVETDVRLSH